MSKDNPQADADRLAELERLIEAGAEADEVTEEEFDALISERSELGGRIAAAGQASRSPASGAEPAAARRPASVASWFAPDGLPVAAGQETSLSRGRDW